MNAIEAGIFSQLAGGTALISSLGGTAIYIDNALDNQAYPYLVFSLQAGGEDTTTANEIEQPLYFVRVWNRVPEDADTIYQLAHARLQEQVFSITGYNWLWCRREQRIDGTEKQTDGTRAYYRGGLYRLVAQRS